MKEKKMLPLRKIKGILALCGLLGSLPLSAPAFAEDAPLQGSGVLIELNKLETSNEACRAYLLFENRSETAFESLKLDLVMFDKEGVVAKRLAVEGAPLPKGKTSLKVFEIGKLRCEGIGRILLNKLTACNDDKGALSNCLSMISTTARGSVPFIK
jgi:hypothetical protein